MRSIAARLHATLAVTLAVSLAPVVLPGGAAPAEAATSCPSAPYGVSRTAPGAGRTVALTFDDGPGRDTGRIESILAGYHVTATFFNLGVNEAAHPATVRAERAAGYALGDHTWDHQSLAGMSASAQAREMDRERNKQASLTGAYPCLFRPPYGNYDSTTLALARNRGMRVWNWSVDTEDWKAAGSGSSYWVGRIRARAEAGAAQLHPVILMHNQPGGNPATVAALPAIIRYYKARGYTFVDLHGFTGPPSVRAVAPTSGRTAGGTRVAVYGHGFGGVRTVRFGGVAGTSVRVLSATKLLVTAPAHAAGAVNIRLSSTHGTSAMVRADRYIYVSPPTVGTVAPRTLPTAGGTLVTITGTNLTHVSAVRFGTATGTGVRVASRTRLVVNAPPHAAGTVDVRVTTAYGTSPARAVDRVTYIAPPTVATVTPGAAATSINSD